MLGMSRRQRNWLMAWLVLVLLMGVVPPFAAIAPSVGYNTRHAHHLGYRFLLAPPSPGEVNPALAGRKSAVDAKVLLFQCLLAGTVLGIAYVVSPGHDAKKHAGEAESAESAAESPAP